MKCESCRFFSGSFAALDYVHAGLGVATDRGIINEPVPLGRRWASDSCGPRPLSTLRSARYSGTSGGIAKTQERQQKSILAPDGQPGNLGRRLKSAGLSRAESCRTPV